MCTKEKGFSQYMYVLCGFQCIKSKSSILNCNPTIHSLKSDKRIMDLKKNICIHFENSYWTHDKRKRHKVICVEKIKSDWLITLCLSLSL